MNHVRNRRLFGVATSVAAVLACGESVDTEGPSEPSDAERFAASFCTAVLQCDDCEAGPVFPNRQGCLEVTAIAYRALADRASEFGMTQDDSCFETELQSHLEYDCVEPVGFNLSCTVFPGNGAVGDDCEILSLVPPVTTCSPDTGCAQSVQSVQSGSWSGKCEAPQPSVSPGGACASEPNGISDLGRCTEGHLCDTRGSLTCIPPARNGEACSADLHCERESHCHPADGEPRPSVEAPGACRLDTPDGQPCTYELECESVSLCRNRTCVAVRDPPEVGTACVGLRLWTACNGSQPCGL